MATKTQKEGVRLLERSAVKPGMVIKVFEKIKETTSKGEIKERLQVFEGMVLAVKNQKLPTSTFLVRKISDGIGVEKIYPLKSPLIDHLELVKEFQVRRAKLYYLRKFKKKLKEKKK